MKLKLSLPYIHEQLVKIHGDLVTIIPETFIPGNKYATFVDKEFGPWRTRVLRVLSGVVCRKRGKRSLVTQVQEKLNILYRGDVVIVPESYKKVGAKATFIDKEFGTYDALVMNVLLGHRGGLKKYKHLHPVTNEPLIDFWQRFGGNKITMQKVVSKYGVDFAIKYLEENLDETGKYKAYISSLESKFQELFVGSVLQVERWNKEVEELKNTDNERSRPDFKLGYKDKILFIDVHGLFIHNELYKDRKYHFDRRIAFENASLRYMQFYEDEIRFHGDIVKSIILNFFGLSQYKFAARKLIIKEVSNIEANKFFTDNHLMGPHHTARSVGLYDKDTLISCLSYRSSFKTGALEISRFATKLNTSCVGGFGKLVSYLRQFNKPIVSYCDLRYGTGKSYVALGFKEFGTTLGWEWTDGVNRFNRTKCKASNGKTEKENATELHWHRIYDAGQRKYQIEAYINEQKI
jgi:hypothetical protein